MRATLLLTLLAAPALAQPTITEIPIAPGYQQSTLYAISADGQTAVGAWGVGATPDVLTEPVPILYSASGGTRIVPGANAAPGPNGYAYAVSGDGRFIAGRLGTNGPYRWTAPGTVTIIPPLDEATQTIALGISRDGSTVVGNSLNSPTHPYFWTPDSGTQMLQGGGGVGVARAVSADGSIIVGSSPSGAARWMNGLFFSYAVNGAAYAINASGLTVVGHITPAGAVSRATRWQFDQFSGSPSSEIDLGVVPGPSPELRRSVAQGVSDDGNTVVGYSTRYQSGTPTTAFPRSAFLWRPAGGMVDLNVYLPTLGLDLTGWDLRTATGVSADGTVIVGAATHNGQPRGYLLRLPHACGTADFDGDGDVGTDRDIEAFFRCLGGTCCATCFPLGADFDADADVGTDRDIEAFFRVLGGNPC